LYGEKTATRLLDLVVRGIAETDPALSSNHEKTLKHYDMNLSVHLQAQI
jgi:hypothetical protein